MCQWSGSYKFWQQDIDRGALIKELALSQVQGLSKRISASRTSFREGVSVQCPWLHALVRLSVRPSRTGLNFQKGDYQAKC